VARTWAELLTQERTLSEAETAWIAEIRQPEHTTAAADEFFNPPVSLFDSVIREALVELEQMAEALLEHGKLSPETLSAAIHAQASVWIQAQEEATRTERDTREARAELNLILKAPPFALNPVAEGVPAPDRIKMRVSIAQITNAWVSASAHVCKETRVEAEQRAVGVRTVPGQKPRQASAPVLPLAP
jgi:hypothetical protein